VVLYYYVFVSLRAAKIFHQAASWSWFS
jgi:hypothetical protein